MNLAQKTVEYFRSAKAEMEKVAWPSKEDTIRYSSLVIGLSLTVAVFFGLLDFGLTKLVDVMISSRATGQVQDVQPDVTPITEPASSTLDIVDVKSATGTN